MSAIPKICQKCHVGKVVCKVELHDVAYLCKACVVIVAEEFKRAKQLQAAAAPRRAASASLSTTSRRPSLMKQAPVVFNPIALDSSQPYTPGSATSSGVSTSTSALPLRQPAPPAGPPPAAQPTHTPPPLLRQDSMAVQMSELRRLSAGLSGRDAHSKQAAAPPNDNDDAPPPPPPPSEPTRRGSGRRIVIDMASDEWQPKSAQFNKQCWAWAKRAMFNVLCSDASGAHKSGHAPAVVRAARVADVLRLCRALLVARIERECTPADREYLFKHTFVTNDVRLIFVLDKVLAKAPHTNTDFAEQLAAIERHWHTLRGDKLGSMDKTPSLADVRMAHKPAAKSLLAAGKARRASAISHKEKRDKRKPSSKALGSVKSTPALSASSPAAASAFASSPTLPLIAGKDSGREDGDDDGDDNDDDDDDSSGGWCSIDVANVDDALAVFRKENNLLPDLRSAPGSGGTGGDSKPNNGGDAATRRGSTNARARSDTDDQRLLLQSEFIDNLSLDVPMFADDSSSEGTDEAAIVLYDDDDNDDNKNNSNNNNNNNNVA